MGVRERKEREREHRKQEILASAKKLFLAHGLEHTSMERIAADAELSKGTLYLYYKNRDELMLSLISEELDHLNQVMSKIIDRKEAPDKKLIHAVGSFYKYSTEHDLLYKVMTHLNIMELIKCAEGEQSEALDNFRRSNACLFELMKRLIQEGVDAGIYHLDHSIDYVVVQLIVCLKGTLVIIQNGMLPPAWLKMEPVKLLQDNARLFVKGMMKSEKS